MKLSDMWTVLINEDVKSDDQIFKQAESLADDYAAILSYILGFDHTFDGGINTYRSQY